MLPFSDIESARSEVSAFLLTPSDALLSHKVDDRLRECLVDTVFLKDRTDVLRALADAPDVGSLLDASGADLRLCTFIMRNFMEWQDVIPGWSVEHGGLPCGQAVRHSLSRDGLILSVQPYARLAAFRREGNGYQFLMSPASRMSFHPNPALIDLGEQVVIRTFYRGCKVELPVLDRLKGTRMLFLQVQERNVNQELRTARGVSSLLRTWLDTGRVDAAEAVGPDLRLLATCKMHGGKKLYHYPLCDIRLVASNRLVGVERILGKSAPPLIKEAAELCSMGMKAIKNEMADPASLHGMVSSAFTGLMDPLPAQGMVRKVFMPMGTDPVRVRKGVQHIRKMSVDSGPVVVLFPDNMSDEVMDKYMRRFMGPAGTLQKRLGGQYVSVRYSPEDMKRPHEVASRVRAMGAVGAVPVWNGGQGRKPLPHMPLEFELMRMGIGVQHLVHDRSVIKMDPKQPAIRQGMAAKFGTFSPPSTGFGPFDLAIGLDVSRKDGKGYAAFPAAYSASGILLNALPCVLHTDSREKRDESEITAAILGCQAAARTASLPWRRVLFLRDGNAYEDYNKVRNNLEEDTVLTVVGVRKNLVRVAGPDLVSTEHYGLFQELSADAFLMGVNAKVSKDEVAGMRTMHAVTIVLNPQGHSCDVMWNALSDLCRHNICSESGVSSLPMPIAYADRLAWTVLVQFLQNKELRQHLREVRGDEIGGNGEESMDNFIYKGLTTYCASRPQGINFAV